MKVILVGGPDHGKEMEVDEGAVEKSCWRITVASYRRPVYCNSPGIGEAIMKLHTYEARVEFGKFVRVGDAILFDYVGLG